MFNITKRLQNELLKALLFKGGGGGGGKRGLNTSFAVSRVTKQIFTFSRLLKNKGRTKCQKRYASPMHFVKQSSSIIF